jgi:lipopolysaccharide transport system permease protein
MWAWTFFSNSIASSSNSIVGNAHLITKVYFPRLIIPVGAVVARFIDFAITSSVLVVLMIYFEVAPTWNILMLPVLIGLLTLLAFSIGVLLSSFNVKYRDVGALLPVVLQLWTFASPILYPLSLVPDKWRWIYILNPVVGIVENLRASLFGGELNLFALSISTAITLILFLISIPVFQRMEQGFADVI